MLETSRLCIALFAGVAAGCTTSAPPVVEAPAAPAAVASEAPARDDPRLAEEAKALVAQAETDVQRARAKRALWLKAWEDLLAARQAASRDPAVAIRRAKQASELAQLGLEQLSYPAVK